MNKPVDREELRNMYPSKLTLDNVRIILGISKRKAAWMLQNGYIECTLTTKRTRRYIVTLDAVFDYLDKVQKCDDAITIPRGLFNAKQSKKSIQMHEMETLYRESIKPNIETFKAWLDDKWGYASEMLTADEVEKITGYTKTSVQGWMYTKKLKSVWTQNKLITTKEWLIDFYVQYGFDMHIMSNKHMKLLKEFCK